MGKRSIFAGKRIRLVHQPQVLLEHSPGGGLLRRPAVLIALLQFQEDIRTEHTHLLHDSVACESLLDHCNW